METLTERAQRRVPSAQPQSSCACHKDLRDTLAGIRQIAQVLTSGRLSPLQLRHMAIEIERMAEWGLRGAKSCATTQRPGPPPATDPQLARLSAKERQVLEGLALGQTVHEIATRVSRSPKTINNHRTNVLHKLGLRNTAELTRFAIRSGVVQA